MVRLLFIIQSLYNLSDEDCEYQVLDRMSFQHFCRLDGALHIPDARTLWSFKQRLAQGGLGGRAVFEAVSQHLQRHGYIRAAGRSCSRPSPRPGNSDARYKLIRKVKVTAANVDDAQSLQGMFERIVNLHLQRGLSGPRALNRKRISSITL